jgi:tRNA nucleotidyltransferase (CCA-adding enzyme)
LRSCGALLRLLPEVDALYGVEQRAEFHPEIDAGLHTEMVLDLCARLAPGDALTGFCGLTHDLGKALTPAAKRPRHPGHEHTGRVPLRALCARLKVPGEYRNQALIACREHLNVHRLAELRDATVLELILRCDGIRKPARIARLGLVCEADKRGRLGLTEAPYPPRAELDRLHAAVLAVRARDLEGDGDPGFGELTGEQVGERLRQARIAAIHQARADSPPQLG